MDATNDTMSGRMRKSGLLYPMMVIAAIAVIVFSAVGIATMMGWMPSALSGGQSAAPPAASMQTPAVADLPAGSRVPAAKALPYERAPASAQTAAAPCYDCGVIESIRAVEVQGDTSWVGAAGGAVVGGLLGNQVGSGRGRTAATVAGAAGGAYAGNQIEKHVKKSVKYQIRVRMEDGTMRTFTRSSQADFAVGQKVRATDRGLVAAG